MLNTTIAMHVLQILASCRHVMFASATTLLGHAVTWLQVFSSVLLLSFLFSLSSGGLILLVSHCDQCRPSWRGVPPPVFLPQLPHLQGKARGRGFRAHMKPYMPMHGYTPDAPVGMLLWRQ